MQQQDIQATWIQMWKVIFPGKTLNNTGKIISSGHYEKQKLLKTVLERNQRVNWCWFDSFHSFSMSVGHERWKLLMSIGTNVLFIYKPCKKIVFWNICGESSMALHCWCLWKFMISLESLWCHMKVYDVSLESLWCHLKLLAQSWPFDSLLSLMFSVITASPVCLKA